MHLFEELVTRQPEGVYYTDIAQRGRSLTIRGVAQSNARVSSLMRQLDSSPYLEDPVLIEITSDKTKDDLIRLSNFVLRVTQAQDKEQDAEGEAGGAT